MRPTLLNKILLCLAAILSLLAQGLVFAPARFTFILQILPAWGNLTFGTLIFVVSLIIFILTLRLKNPGPTTDWILLAIHILTVIGTYLLLDFSASHTHEVGFLFTAAITTLTSFGILANLLSEKDDALPSQIDIVESETPLEPIP